MWVRSQDREKLVNCKGFYIRKFSDLEKRYHINKNQSNYAIADELQGSILGYYSTKEKAMKVMDMIQNEITGTRFEFTDIVRDCDLAGIEIHNVFNMPKDEEVK